MIASIALVLCIFSVVESTSAFNGLIEGYNWQQSQSIGGEYDQYTYQMRDSLIEYVGKKTTLRAYIYSPQDSEESPFTLTPWSPDAKSNWCNTITKANNVGVKVIMGIHPRYIDDYTTTLNAVKAKLNDFSACGIDRFIMSFDDVAGAGTTGQQQQQAKLATAVNGYKSIKLVGIVPASYSRSISGTSDNNSWGQSMSSLLSKLNSSISIIVTGTDIVPSKITANDYPHYGPTRQTLFFDNWIATDSRDRITTSQAPQRAPAIYNESPTILGTVLNLAFPPERVIHQVYAMDVRSRNGSYASAAAAAAWTDYLRTYRPDVLSQYDNDQQVAADLQGVLDQGLESNDDIVNSYPNLQPLFQN
ncbi:hypothetical protein PROFUN_12919 [Planoprotostelium fungivorum]|uniref:GH84 domain-containing protein n=1 Tax=Planoprotostelium fungivorum TaxID=1890364 RepID=A0A2P6N5Z2_9EUKA|nr:hypothetical protein PROFUN_12919 [Planoprotostelium fungivorum]